MVTGGRSDLLLPGGRAPNHHLTGGAASLLWSQITGDLHQLMSAPVSALITVEDKTSDYTITYIPAQSRDSFNLNIPLNSSKRLVLL